ncbi:hypothetical protein ACIQU5_14525 [Streptomyces sp. NPDC090306]|uniref:hypothetical protein n=1 Tax=Streptomyces sp. NPDC090306 TaxID=3365961 RepID=UPI003809C3F1
MTAPEFTLGQLRNAESRLAELQDPERQLAQARQQAESYRTYLSSLTGLLTAVFVLKGQENLSKMDPGPRWTVVILLVVGFLGLITASWCSVLAAHGRPGVEILAEPGTLLRYERRRTREIWRLVEAARWLGLTGVLAVAAAVLVTWVFPGK